MFAPRPAPLLRPPRLGEADRVCFANRSIPRWRRLARCRIFHDKNVHYVHNLIFIDDAIQIKSAIYAE